MQPDQEEFTIGQRVRYLPHAANGNPFHPDCEDGEVTRHGRYADAIWVSFNGRPEMCCGVSQIMCIESIDIDGVGPFKPKEVN